VSGRAPFRGWWIVGVGFATQSVSMGFSIMSFPLFVPFLVEEFGTERGPIVVGQSIFLAVMQGVGSVLGRVLDRRSIRAVMVLGALVMAASLVALSRATALWQLGILFGVLLSIGVTMLGPLASATLAAKWFRRKLGRAQGLTNMGGPAGGLFFAPVAGALLAAYGWRTTLVCFAGMTLVVIPALWAVVRNQPADLGQDPDGEAQPALAEGGAHAGLPWGPARLVRARAFWCLALPLGVLMGISTAWIANFATFAADLGVGTGQASLYLGVGSGVGILSTLAFGALSDRFDGRVLLWVIMAMHAAAFAILRTLSGAEGFLPLVIALGAAGGGMMPVYASLIGRIFGPASFGAVMGFAGLVMLPFFFALAPLAAALRDGSGSYAGALLLFIAALAAAATLLGFLRLEPRELVAASPARA
jgi:MFS family permease